MPLECPHWSICLVVLICYADAAIKGRRAVQETGSILNPADNSDEIRLQTVIRELPFNNQYCPWGQLRHHLHNESRCCQMVSCPPGYEVRICNKSGNRDTCERCQPGYIQLNNVTSLNMSEATCFKNRSKEYDKCTWREQKASGHQMSHQCPVWCQCVREDCYYLKEECSCFLQRQPCPPGQTMNYSGVCVPCLWGSYKLHTGCGPCTLNLTLISEGKPSKIPAPPTSPTTTIATTTRRSSEETGKPIHIKGSDLSEKQDNHQPGKPENTNIVIVVAVPAALVCLVSIIGVVVYKKRSPQSRSSASLCLPCIDREVYTPTIPSRSNSTESTDPGMGEAETLIKTNKNNNNIAARHTDPTANKVNINQVGNQRSTVGHDHGVISGHQVLPQGNMNPSFIASRQNSTIDGSLPESPLNNALIEINQHNESSNIGQGGNAPGRTYQTVVFNGTFNNCPINIHQTSPPVVNHPPVFPPDVAAGIAKVVCNICNNDTCTCNTSLKTASTNFSLPSESNETESSINQSASVNSLAASRDNPIDGSVSGDENAGKTRQQGTRADGPQSIAESEQGAPSGGNHADSSTGACSLPTKSNNLVNNHGSLQGDVEKGVTAKLAEIGQEHHEQMVKQEDGVRPVDENRRGSEQGVVNLDPRSQTTGAVLGSPRRRGHRNIQLPVTNAGQGLRQVATVKPMITNGSPLPAGSDTDSTSYQLLHASYDGGLMTDYTDPSHVAHFSPNLSSDMFQNSLDSRPAPEGQELSSGHESPETCVKQVYNLDETVPKRCLEGQVNVTGHGQTGNSGQQLPPTLKDGAVSRTDALMPKGATSRAMNVQEMRAGAHSAEDLGHNAVNRALEVGVTDVRGPHRMANVQTGFDRFGVEGAMNRGCDGLNGLHPSVLSGSSFELDPGCDVSERDEPSFELAPNCDMEDDCGESDTSFELTSVA